jgi:hypothetical protein
MWRVRSPPVKLLCRPEVEKERCDHDSERLPINLYEFIETFQEAIAWAVLNTDP